MTLTFRKMTPDDFPVCAQELKREPQPISHMSLITERGFPSVPFYENNGFVELKNELTMAGYVN